MASSRSSRIPSIRREPATFPPYPEPTGDERATLTAWLKALSVEPLSAVEWSCPAGWAIRNRTIPDDMAFCILSGRFAGCVRSRRDERPISPGDMLVIPRGVAHWIRRVSGSCRMVAIHMHARVYGAIDALSLFGLEGVTDGLSGDLVCRTVGTLAREYATRPIGWRRSMRAGMEQIVLEALRHRVSSRGARIPTRFSPDIASLQPALEVINARLYDPTLRIRDIAAAIYVSEPTLRTKFRKVFGVSPVLFVRHERVARACLMLRTTHQTIPRIAAQCGFGDVPFFYRIFKGVVGTTPARYREGGDV